MNRTATAGPEAGVETLFDQHAELVWNHGYRLTGNWSQAGELVTATFAKAWHGNVRLVDDSALPWLYVTAGAIARAWRLEPVSGVDLRTRMVAEAVRALPRSEREIAELCLLGEVSVADTAVVLGLTEAATLTRLSRAETRLRTALEGNR